MTKPDDTPLLDDVLLDDASTVRLLSQLVSMESCDPPGRELEIAQFVQAFLQRYGVDVELQEFLPGRANVLAKIKGTGTKPALIFSAHLDTVPIGDQPWDYPPFGAAIDNGRLYGRGATDMKSGMAAMIAAAIGVARRQQALNGDLLLAFSAGESSNCLGATEFVNNESLKEAGALLVSEPSSLKVLVAEKGALWVRAIAKGRSGHPSGAGSVSGAGINAIIEMKSLLTKLQNLCLTAEEHPLLGRATVSVGTIRGGNAVNLTPDRCEAELDFRLLPGQSPELVLKTLREIAGGNFEFVTIDYKPPVETPSDHPFVHLCQKACSAFGQDDVTPGGVAYYSDGAVLAPALNVPMVIIGPGELGMSGQCNEYVEVDKLLRASRIYYRIACDYLGS